MLRSFGIVVFPWFVAVAIGFGYESSVIQWKSFNKRCIETSENLRSTRRFFKYRKLGTQKCVRIVQQYLKMWGAHQGLAHKVSIKLWTNWKSEVAFPKLLESPVGKFFYYILCVDISVIKPWLKTIPAKWYDIISLQWNDIISLHGLNCPIK